MINKGALLNDSLRKILQAENLKKLKYTKYNTLFHRLQDIPVMIVHILSKNPH